METNPRARILIVDDDLPIRDLLATVLEEAGYAVTQAFNGRHALDLLALESPDLIISDMMMPIVSGETLCRHVKERSDIPVILMSSATNQAGDVGHDAFLSKPFDLNLLESLIERVLREKTQAQTSMQCGS